MLAFLKQVKLIHLNKIISKHVMPRSQMRQSNTQ